MDENFFTNLPPVLLINILSRLPVKSVVRCKCVCKSWFHLLQTREFSCSHLSKSPPGIIVYLHGGSFRNPVIDIQFFEFLDTIGLDQHELHYNLVTRFNINLFISPLHDSISLDGSVDGLLFLRDINLQPQALYICNPITREYINPPTLSTYAYPTIVTYGFGMSKITGQYKLVRIYHEVLRDPNTQTLLSIPNSKCEVYTIGTGSWRSVAPDYSHAYNCRSTGAFLNGCLHWLVSDLNDKLLVSCFDLETEQFSILLPPARLHLSTRRLFSLTVLEDELCICNNGSEDEIVIWIMKEYGAEKSWEKSFVVRKDEDFAGECYEVVYPLKVFKDGDMLMSWQDFRLFYYSNRSKSVASLDLFGDGPVYCIHTCLHVPSFVSLKSFVMENVLSF